MTAEPTESPIDPNAGTARLPVVVPVAIISFFYASILEYSLPLYFGALGEVDESYPADIWSDLATYQVTPWIIGPVLAGLFARRYGERFVWSAALLGKVAVPTALAISPDPTMIKIVALWQGFTGALMWIAGISLIQMVAPNKKGLSNGLLMASLGVGSVLGPIAGRAILYRAEIWDVCSAGNWNQMWSKLFSFSPMTSTPQVSDFQLIFGILTASTFVCGIAIGLWGQRSGQFERAESPDWNRTWQDVGELVRDARFWAFVMAMCMLGGPVFQASNQFLPYRAEDLGLKSAAEDHGWIWLNLLKTLMWIPGGLAVGFLAGRRAPGVAAVIMLAAFAITVIGIGESRLAWQLFACVAVFEFVRQFMRWSHAGFLSELMPSHLRATAIGCSITFSGLGSTIYAWIAGDLWNPDTQGFDSSAPFLCAGILGIIGSAGLIIFDRITPIRQESTDETD